MKKLLYILLTLLCFCSCTDSYLDSPTAKEGEPVELILNFGAQNLEHNIVTRQTMPEISDEAKIYNLYIYIFDNEGNKIYGRYFDVADVLASTNAVASSTEDAWYVNIPEGDSQSCSGTIKIHTIARSGCKIFGVSNIDSKMVSVSPEVLNQVQHQDELLDMVVTCKYSRTIWHAAAAPYRCKGTLLGKGRQ